MLRRVGRCELGFEVAAAVAGSCPDLRGAALQALPEPPQAEAQTTTRPGPWAGLFYPATPASPAASAIERRVDMSNGCAYTKAEFGAFYCGNFQWDGANSARPEPPAISAIPGDPSDPSDPAPDPGHRLQHTRVAL
jgi:hypothetical protein